MEKEEEHFRRVNSIGESKRVWRVQDTSRAVKNSGRGSQLSLRVERGWHLGTQVESTLPAMRLDLGGGRI